MQCCRRCERGSQGSVGYCRDLQEGCRKGCSQAEETVRPPYIRGEGSYALCSIRASLSHSTPEQRSSTHRYTLVFNSRLEHVIIRVDFIVTSNIEFIGM
eukprot:scaffold2244_cov25-Cyclotella_meneghiniana.AAC.1